MANSFQFTREVRLGLTHQSNGATEKNLISVALYETQIPLRTRYQALAMIQMSREIRTIISGTGQRREASG